MQLVEPMAQARRGIGHVRQGACQGGRGLVEAVQFQRAHQIERADEQRDHQRQRVRADVPGADPTDGAQAHEKCEVLKKSSHSLFAKGFEQPFDRLQSNIQLGKQHALHVLAENV